VEAAGPEVPALENAGSWLGAIMAQASLAGRDKLSFVISGKIKSFGHWAEQRSGSTGKEGKELPSTRTTRNPECYGQDRILYTSDWTTTRHMIQMYALDNQAFNYYADAPYDVGEIFRWNFSAVAGMF
jgi:hypothetical protein